MINLKKQLSDRPRGREGKLQSSYRPESTNFSHFHFQHSNTRKFYEFFEVVPQCILVSQIWRIFVMKCMIRYG
jgi:hypothetical protein